jgi:predicted permease
MNRRIRPHLWLVSLISRMVPRRFRSDWKEEWKAELVHRESVLARRSQSDWKARNDLIRRGLASFWDALAMQPRRLEEEFLQDIRYAIRLLIKQKAITAVAIVSLAVGIGANTALFSLIDAMLLKKLPVHNPDDLVLFNWSAVQAGMDLPLSITFDGNRTDPGTGRTTWDSFSYRVFEQFRTSNKTLSAIFAFARIYRANIVADGNAEIGDGELVSGGYFNGLGVSTIAGRPIQDSDDNTAAAPVAVLGYRYWQQRFGLDPAIVGKTLKVNNVSLTVIGIAPPDFSGTLQVQDSPDIYVPMALEPLLVSPNGGGPIEMPDWWWLQIMGRVRPGVSPEQVRGNMDGVFQQNVREISGNKSPSPFSPTLEVVSGSRGLYSSRETYSQPLMILMVIMGLVLLIACVNVANLLLARAATRQREIVTRLSIGATRLRLIRQLLTESVVLASLGGSLGIVFGYWGKDLLLKWGPWGIQSEQVTVRMDLRVLGFAIAISVFTGILFGIVPAMRSVRTELAPALIQNARTLSAGRTRVSKSLLVLQVAMSLVLMVGAAFFIQTLWKLKHVDVGFDTGNVLLFKIDPTLNRYPVAQFTTAMEQITERLQAIEGVRGVTVSDSALIADGGNFGSRNRSDVRAAMLGIRWNFFQTMGVPVVSGRSFTPQDNAIAPKVALINETLARRYFPDANPVGKRVWDAEIVGVVRDTKIGSVRRDIPPAVFTPYLQERPRRMTFQIRFTDAARALIPAFRNVVKQVDSNLPVYDIRTLEEQVDRTQLSQAILFANFASAFGAVALFLVCVGLYGVTSYNVARRTHEIGIRIALGAKTSTVRTMVMQEILFLVLVGVGLGLAGALTLTNKIRTMLFGITPNDPMTVFMAIAVLVGVAAFSGYLPARRASKVDPMIALRYE